MKLVFTSILAHNFVYTFCNFSFRVVSANLLKKSLINRIYEPILKIRESTALSLGGKTEFSLIHLSAGVGITFNGI